MYFHADDFDHALPGKSPPASPINGYQDGNFVGGAGFNAQGPFAMPEKLSFGLRLEHQLDLGFRLWGIFVAKNSVLVIFISLAISLILALGVSKWQVTTDPVDLWVPSGSRARQDMDMFEKNFWKFYRIEQVMMRPSNGQLDLNVTIPGEDGLFNFGPVLKKDFLIEAHQLYQAIVNLVAKRDGRPITLDKICYKPLGQDKDCASQSIFTFFSQDNLTAMAETSIRKKFLDCTRCVSFPTRVSLDSIFPLPCHVQPSVLSPQSSSHRNPPKMISD